MNSFPIYCYNLLIREHHLDMFGHVNNARYLEILEEARWDLVDSKGFGVKKIQEEGQGYIVLEMHIQYLKELRLREQIIVETQLQTYEGKVGLVKQWIKNNHGEVCCQADLKIALMDLITRKIITPTPEWLKVMGA